MEFDDVNAWGIAGVVTLLVVLFAFRDPAGVGFDEYPLKWKIILCVVTAPVMYAVAYWNLNK